MSNLATIVNNILADSGIDDISVVIGSGTSGYIPVFTATGRTIGDSVINQSGGNVLIGGNIALHAGNFNSYAPTLGGIGASGTWGISITGNADTVDGYHMNQNLLTSSSPTFSGLTNNGNINVNGIGIFTSSSDHQISLRSPDAWTGIEFDDSAGGFDYIWFNGLYQTFAIGGGGSSVLGKKLHIDGGTTIGVNYDSTSVPTNGLAVEGTIKGAAYFDSQANSGFRLRNSVDSANVGGFTRRGLWEGNSNYDPAIWAETGYGLYLYTNGSASPRITVDTNGNTTIHGALGVGQSPNTSYRVITAGDIYLNGNANGWAEGTWKQRRGGGTYYDVIDTGNFNSYAPTLTGGGASGTWGINISGNADTVDGYHAAQIYTYIANEAGSYLGGHYSSGGNEKPNSNTFGAGKLKIAMLSNSNLGFSGPWNDVLWISTYNGGDVKSSHALVFDKYSTNVWVSDQNFDSGSWGTGYLLLHSGNYNSFAPTLTGGGASGTWGINITGNASNTSSISNAVGSSYTWTGEQYFQSNLGGYSGSLSSPPLQAYSTANNSAFMSFHKSGQYAVNMGLDADNVLRIGGWSAAANRWQLDMSGHNTVAGSFRAPIFFDSENTNYYLDPNSTTSLRTVGSWRADSSNWDGEFNGKIQYHSNHWYFQAAGEWIFRNSNGSNIFYVTQSGRTYYNDYIVSRNSGGMMGDYNVAGTSEKVIWTIGESWPLPNMYGLGYSYGSGYGHHLALKNNGTTYSRIGFAGDAYFTGQVIASSEFRSPMHRVSDYTTYGQFGTYSGYMTSMAYLSFDWDASYNSYSNHGIASTSRYGSFSDNMSINSYNDINLRIDTNDNDSSSYVRFHHHTTGDNTFSYIGYNADIGQFQMFLAGQFCTNTSGYCYNDGYFSSVYGSGIYGATCDYCALYSISTCGIYITNYGAWMNLNPNYPVFSPPSGECFVYDGNCGNLYIGGNICQNWYSDCKYKENITEIDSALDKIDALRGVEFDWNELGEEEVFKKGHEVGLIAQEVQVVYPQAVREVSKEREDHVVTALVVDYDKFTPLLIQSIKELNAKVDTLKSRIDAGGL